jgi:hypothetical protein
MPHESQQAGNLAARFRARQAPGWWPIARVQTNSDIDVMAAIDRAVDRTDNAEMFA